MIDKEQFLDLIKRLFFPEPRKWAARLLIIAGVGTLASPLLGQILMALLGRYTDLKIDTDPTTGWWLIGLGLMLVVVNFFVDRMIAVKVNPALAASDRAGLEELYSNIHKDTFDAFFHYGRLTYTYVPTLHFYFGIQAFVESASYHFNDSEVKTEVDGFYSGLHKALTKGEYFHEASNDKLMKFDSRHDIYVDPEAKHARDEFLTGVMEGEVHLKNLNQLVKTKFPDFDFKALSDAAFEEYKRYQLRAEQAWAEA